MCDDVNVNNKNDIHKNDNKAIVDLHDFIRTESWTLDVGRQHDHTHAQPIRQYTNMKYEVMTLHYMTRKHRYHCACV